jgi:hypothetical protein
VEKLLAKFFPSLLEEIKNKGLRLERVLVEILAITIDKIKQ